MNIDDLDKCVEVIEEQFTEVNPQEFASKIKEEFIQDKSLWYKVIAPPTKANELMLRTHGDYSLIWHEHCACCWDTINKCSHETCFVSSNRLTWLCKNCYKKLFDKSD